MRKQNSAKLKKINLFHNQKTKYTKGQVKQKNKTWLSKIDKKIIIKHIYGKPISHNYLTDQKGHLLYV